ncbi:DeoR/GlpR family DNA-binding transcription regulator [Streptomyces sp. 769]|uniref:DeoR/GlpR family DNA-binding transcription regulator n=1 Tax=Streptomyces sp. 769 TaxID=1262452 RepID=UPI00057DEC2B|nr:DeoR/GlpR family DNA-binding transcription regulator [Streptomyces sp. 769]AJC56903.1 transcriptional regulator of sugar metabolism [Streptomyces sp. 769]
MTDTEGAADAPDASQAPVTRLSPKDRRKRISDRVLAEGQVTIEELVQELGVSQMTVCEAALALAEPGQAVITNSLQVINELAEEPDIRVIALGGEYHAAFNAFLGMSTADIARSFRADIAFLSTSAVDDGHRYHQAQENVLVKRALRAAARRTVLLVDHSTFGRQALYELAPLADFDLVISDGHLPREEQEALQSLGVRDELATEGSRRG